MAMDYTLSSSRDGHAQANTITRKNLDANLSNGGLLRLRRMRVQDNTPPHDHTFDELAFVRAGTGMHVTERGRERLHPGDVIIVRPMVWHAYDQCEDLWIDNLLFDAEFLTHILPLFDQGNTWLDLFQRRSARWDDSPLVIRLNEAEQQIVFWALDSMAREEESRVLGWEACNSAAALMAITHTARSVMNHGIEPVSRLSHRTEQAVVEVAQIIADEFRQSLTVAHLAKRVSLSQHHLSRSFASQMGVGIVDYLLQHRIKRACHLLRTTDKPIADIAILVGYDEIAYFSRRFRQQVGCSPSSYRQRFRGQ